MARGTSGKIVMALGPTWAEIWSAEAQKSASATAHSATWPWIDYQGGIPNTVLISHRAVTIKEQRVPLKNGQEHGINGQKALALDGIKMPWNAKVRHKNPRMSQG